MDGHGYTVAAVYDTDKNEIPYDALDYADYTEAQAALDALEKKHGELDIKRKRFDPDLETITAEFLIENIDLAFHSLAGKALGPRSIFRDIPRTHPALSW